VLRRLASSLFVAALALAACTGAPAISDPEQIITKGVEATSTLSSFTINLAVDGTFSMPEGGGSFALDGTTLDGVFDLDAEAAQLSFAVPAFLALTGDVIIIGTDSYVRTSMTGETWSKSTTSSGDPVSEAMDPDAALQKVRDFLDKEGVEAKKLDDVDCGERTCYAVQLTIPSELLAEAGDQVDVSPSQVLGEALVLNLRFDREKLWLTEVSTAVESESVVSFSATLTFSNFDEAVTVSPPPAVQVSEGELPLSFLVGFRQ
jgi:hypothetical protein